ncbi:winged helix-turn-helix domain-containing protein [Nocardia arthritidis]|uniref:Helix-turn-helix domain-containing protein n=1 Tax=Nocardia arthritidis TaxID=228602 RepID=A0A6G9YN90_9NOCA|nr:helix-turn-helix domain-containing protein [Nocardia arthritidis]QIS14590.1 helix-turn-helix domain-containing protein [Nocardia arthritidis]
MPTHRSGETHVAEEMTSAQRTALYRSLAHPLRAQILDYLGKHSEANSATLAEVLHESTGTTSYHLRKLAELGLIEEIAEKSAGRERWWKSLPYGHTSPDPATMEPAEYAAAAHLAGLKTSRDIELYLRAMKEYSGPTGWAQVRRTGTYMTHEQWVAFIGEYHELVMRYATQRADAPEGARAMNIRFFAVPEDPA